MALGTGVLAPVPGSAQARNPGRGRMVIEFYDLDQFDGLLSQLGFNNS